MLSGRTPLLSFVALCMCLRSACTCDTELAETVLEQIKIIPILDPANLNERCQQLNESLHCLLSEPVNVESLRKVYNIRYTTILKMIEYPCHTASQEYLSGAACWRSPQLPHMLTNCYSNNQQVIRSTFCTGQKHFINCTARAILLLPGCGMLEQYLLRAMVTTSHNAVCDQLPIPSWKHLITDTTPVTMTTTTPLSVLSSVGRQRTGVTLTNNEDPEVTMKTEVRSRNSVVATNGPGHHAKTQTSTGNGSRVSSVVTVYAVAASMSVFIIMTTNAE